MRKKLTVIFVSVFFSLMLCTCGKSEDTEKLVGCEYVPEKQSVQYIFTKGHKNVYMKPMHWTEPAHYILTYSNGKTEEISVEEYNLNCKSIQKGLSEEK